MGCCCSKAEVAPTHSDQKYIVPKAAEPQKVETNGRYNKIGISTSDPSLLIEGYEKESLCSLEEALKPFDGKISRLNEQIRDAKAKCYYPNEHHLTQDESAALYLYLSQEKGDTVYNSLEQSWSKNNRAEMTPWFKYLKLLKSALDKLPKVRCEVWQGNYHDKDLEKLLQPNSKPELFTKMGLTSPSFHEIKKNLQQQSNEKMLFVGFKYAQGKDVTGYGPSNQKETFIWPGIKLTRGKQVDSDKIGSMIFHLNGKTRSQLEEEMEEKLKEKHYVCPDDDCPNSCRGNHPEGHCYGFERLLHKCSHHCGPVNECAICKKEYTDLCECKKCHKRSCDHCSYKMIKIEPRIQ